MSKKVLIVDRVHPTLLDDLTQAGFFCEIAQNLTYENYLSLQDEYEGLIIRSRFQLDESAIDSKSQLKWIVRIGSGMENIDIAYAKRQGIECISTPEGNAPSVAEHCLALLLSALRNVGSSTLEIKEGLWEREKNKSVELRDRTVGIIGYGHTGKAFARLLQNFGCKIYIYDKYYNGFEDEHIEETSLKDLIAQSDIISIHINYEEENHHFFNKNLIEYAEKPFIFINTSRGLTVNTSDIINALKQGKIQHACLDVLEYENTQLTIPPKTKWSKDLKTLSQMSGVTLTPHIAGQTFTAEKRHAEVAFERINQLIKEE